MRWLNTFILALTFAAALIAAPADQKAQAKEKTEKKTQTAQKVKDPICGMEVDPKTADKATYQGKTYYFCSRDEKVEFEKNPSKYAKK